MTRLVCGMIAGLIAAVCTRTIMAQCNTIDAVTSASFKITGGEACSTFAKLNWTFTKSNGTMIVKWGTSTSYGTQKSVYASNPINITGLSPITKYFYAVDGTYEGRVHQYTRSSFTTSSSGTVGVAGRATGKNRIAIFRIGNCDLAVPAIHGETVAIDLFTLNGTTVSGRILLSANGTTGPFKNIFPGVYLAKASWRNGSTQQRVVISK